MTLVGAGPGDPELMTLKGMRAIEDADVILYDALANEAILEANPRAHRVFVGKRLGWQAYTQDEINGLLLRFARMHSHVVRLKGGDPMVFGRAAEEIDALRRHGIAVEVVPGISSYSGMAAAAQMSLTKRGESESFWVTTGTTSSGEVSGDIRLAAQSSATVLVLMGMRHLPQIVATFSQYKPLDYPVCIVQHATLPNERTVVGQLGDILALKAAAGISNPAVIVFGAAAMAVGAGRSELLRPHLANVAG